MSIITTGNDLCKILISDEYEELSNILYEIIDRDKKYDKAVIITDEVVDKNLYKDLSNNIFDKVDKDKFIKICIKSGENFKNIDTYNEIIEKLINYEVSRNSLIIAFGGGVIGDISGFVASTYMRGLDYIQVPTTILSQVDSSIGGKNGLDVGIYKNMIGTIKQPLFTYININTLKTLPKEEINSGFGEIIKYSAIMDDDGLFADFLYKNVEDIKKIENKKIIETILKCAKFKAGIVKADEKDLGLRKILNFGHTFGHAIEREYGLKHGESVAYGMKISFDIALSKNYINENYYNKFLKLIKIYDFHFELKKINIERVIEVMKKDKKNSFNEISIILPDADSCVGIFKMKAEMLEKAMKSCNFTKI